MDVLNIAIADPTLDDVRQLVEHHLAFGRLHSPPQDAHALEVDGLLDPAVTLFSIRRREDWSRSARSSGSMIGTRS